MLSRVLGGKQSRCCAQHGAGPLNRSLSRRSKECSSGAVGIQTRRGEAATQHGITEGEEIERDCPMHCRDHEALPIYDPDISLLALLCAMALLAGLNLCIVRTARQTLSEKIQRLDNLDDTRQALAEIRAETRSLEAEGAFAASQQRWEMFDPHRPGRGPRVGTALFDYRAARIRYCNARIHNLADVDGCEQAATRRLKQVYCRLAEAYREERRIHPQPARAGESD